MSIYSEVGSCVQQVGGKCPDGWVVMQEQRPTESHVAQADGSWIVPAKTAEDLREEWKSERSAAVEAIKVTTLSGNTFDGDEVSQGRMARAVSSMEDADTVLWVLADNSVIQATRAELREALRLAGSAQAAIWVLP